MTHEHLVLDAMDHYGGYEFVIDDEPTVIEEMKEFTRRSRKVICDPTLDIFVPMLRERDVDEQAVEPILVTSPARAFARQTPHE